MFFFDYKKLQENGQCLLCKTKIESRISKKEFPNSSNLTIDTWNQYCSNCRTIYKCHICKEKFLQDEETYWKDVCLECRQPTCIKCRDMELDTDYDDDSTCLKCSKQ